MNFFIYMSALNFYWWFYQEGHFLHVIAATLFLAAAGMYVFEEKK